MAKFGIEYRVRGSLPAAPPLIKAEPFDVRKRIVIIAKSEEDARSKGGDFMRRCLGRSNGSNYRLDLLVIRPLREEQIKDYIHGVPKSSHYYVLF